MARKSRSSGLNKTLMTLVAAAVLIGVGYAIRYLHKGKSLEAAYQELLKKEKECQEQIEKLLAEGDKDTYSPSSLEGRVDKRLEKLAKLRKEMETLKKTMNFLRQAQVTVFGIGDHLNKAPEVHAKYYTCPDWIRLHGNLDYTRDGFGRLLAYEGLKRHGLFVLVKNSFDNLRTRMETMFPDCEFKPLVDPNFENEVWRSSDFT